MKLKLKLPKVNFPKIKFTKLNVNKKQLIPVIIIIGLVVIGIAGRKSPFGKNWDKIIPRDIDPQGETVTGNANDNKYTTTSNSAFKLAYV